MRMSRVKRRRLNLQQRRERMHCRKKAAAALLTGLAAGAPLRADAVTLNVLQDIYAEYGYGNIEGNKYDGQKERFYFAPASKYDKYRQKFFG